tara:strand:+ start:500 stop:712 length:213 start_codon:yes stop_codon:yes gene_type:complete
LGIVVERLILVALELKGKREINLDKTADILLTFFSNLEVCSLKYSSDFKSRLSCILLWGCIQGLKSVFTW